MLDLHKPKERVLGIISEMQAISAQIGERDDLAQEIAGLRAQLDVVQRNLKMAQQEFAECRAAYNKYAGMAAEEAKKHERLIAENKRLTADNNKLSAERQRVLQMFGG
jgi:hypothetical protein